VKRIVPELPTINGESSLNRGWRKAVTQVGNQVERNIFAYFTPGIENEAGVNTTLISTTIPANYLAKHGERLKIAAFGGFANTASTNKRVRLTVGTGFGLLFESTSWASQSSTWRIDLDFHYGPDMMPTANALASGRIVTQIAAAPFQMDQRIANLAGELAAPILIALKGSGTNAGDVFATGMTIDWIGAPLI
jgi:hypothetical protein